MTKHLRYALLTLLLLPFAYAQQSGGTGGEPAGAVDVVWSLVVMRSANSLLTIPRRNSMAALEAKTA